MALLDLAPFQSAITQLADALNAFSREPENPYIRDSVIKRFEFTYELAWKMLKRYLEAAAANRQEIEALSFPALIRAGSSHGLLRTGWNNWYRFRDARNMTSHVYNQAKAIEVAAIAPEFLLEAEYLLTALLARNG